MKNHALREKIEFTNVRHLVEWASKNHAGKIAYSYKLNSSDKEDITVTFEQFANDVRALSSQMLEMGCAGKHISLIGKFSYQWSLTYFSALSIGAVLVPLDRDWLKEDLCDTVKKANVQFLFGDADISDKIEHIASSLNLTQIYLTSNENENTVTNLIEKGRVKFEGNPEAYYEAPIDPMKMSLLVFTSGTTGKGKGVMLSQNAILSDIYNAAHYIDFGNKTVGVLPLHHTYGSTIMLIGHMMIGCEVYISSGLRYIAKELKEEKPEHLVLVPLYLETFYRKILSSLKEKGKYDLVFRMIKVSNAMRKMGVDKRRSIFKAIHETFGGKLKLIITGGAPINPEIIKFYEDIGITVLNGYGITECAPLISVNRTKNNVIGSVGNTIDNVTVKIDEPNEVGEGEILVKGPNVMLGYYKDLDATADAFKNGYFRTGDYGKIGKNGTLFITGRKKNLIILSNGKNVYPEEIENELIATPGILDIIVYEGQSKRGLEYNTIVAEVYPDKEYFEKNNIESIYDFLKPYIDDFNKHTIPYKKIGILKVRDEEFPKNTLRKIQRFKLDTAIE